MRIPTPRLRTLAAAACCALCTLTAPAPAQHFYDSAVDIDWNTLHDHTEMTALLHQLVDAYPELLTMKSIGKSVGGLDLWLVTLNNPETGPDTAKTAMFIDGNIHGNEIQSAEVVLYSIWYLTKSHGRIEKLTTLIDERAFYFVPMANPDGRQKWFHTPATPHYLRGGIRPTDNDADGLLDEDGYDDLDGDGHITQMYVRDPSGRWKPDPDDERFFTRVANDEEPGGWERLGSEGFDNDGDGQINEDGPGGYDPNRNWPSDWQPNHVQRGAGDYPFSLPETRAVGMFVFAHPNIAAFQSYHNTGGMILRGPAASYIPYPGADDAVFKTLTDKGEEILPFYRGLVTHKDLYTVHGGEKGWAYEGLGIIGFTNELWSDSQMMGVKERATNEQRTTFRDLVQFGEVFVPYREVEHPTYGTVMVGGTKKWSSRVSPPFMMEEELHRNFAFTMYHADEMPKVGWGLLQVAQRDSGLWEITVEVRNDKVIPSILALARQKKIGDRDLLTCTARRGATVVACGNVDGMLPTSNFTVRDTPQPEKLWNHLGIGSNGRRLFRFLVEGTGGVELEYSSRKGGTITLPVPLTAREAGPAIPEDD